MAQKTREIDMSTYNESLLNRTPEEQALREEQRKLREAKKRANTAKKIADVRYKTKLENDKVAANQLLVEKGYAHLSSRNVASHNSKGRYDYEMVKYGNSSIAVPVTPVRRKVPAAAVRATGASRSPEDLKRDKMRKSSVVHSPTGMSAYQYVDWKKNPGRSDVVGIDCRSNCKPTVSMNARSIPAYKVRTPVSRNSTTLVKVPGGKPVIVPYDKNGNVPRAYLKAVDAQRANSSRALDASRTSKRVLSDVGTPYQMRPWIVDPGSCDIRGIDAPANAKVTVHRPRTEAEAKAIQARKNKINGKKGGKATAAKVKAAKKTSKPAAKPVAKKAAKPVAKPVAKKAAVKAPAKPKLPARDASGKFVAKKAAKPASKPRVQKAATPEERKARVQKANKRSMDAIYRQTAKKTGYNPKGLSLNKKAKKAPAKKAVAKKPAKKTTARKK